MGAKVFTEKIIIDDHTASKFLKMAEKFFSDPENQRKYTEWHKQTYGCLPNETKRGG